MAANAKPIPVLPDVPSMMVPPGFRRPSASASSTIFTAMRSFTEFPGLKVSTLASTKASTSAVTLLRRTSGVLPMVPSMFSEYFIFKLLSFISRKDAKAQRKVLFKISYKYIDKKKVCKFD